MTTVIDKSKLTTEILQIYAKRKKDSEEIYWQCDVSLLVNDGKVHQVPFWTLCKYNSQLIQHYADSNWNSIIFPSSEYGDGRNEIEKICKDFDIKVPTWEERYKRLEEANTFLYHHFMSRNITFHLILLILIDG